MRNANLSTLEPKRQQRFLLRTLALILFLSVASWCQDQATVVGVVTDSSNALVAGAKVTVVNAQRGITRETTSNSSGEYAVAKVPIGDYEITASRLSEAGAHRDNIGRRPNVASRSANDCWGRHAGSYRHCRECRR
jgi:hypothetical protein